MKSRNIFNVLLLFCVFTAFPLLHSQKKPEKPAKKINYAPYPEPDHGYVTDIAGLLTPEAKERIERWLWQLESRSGVEIAVVTIYSIKDYPGTNNDCIEYFATGLLNKYKIGNKTDNNGILLLVAKKDRKVTISLGNFYGPADDAKAEKILNSVITPRFKENKYEQGISDGVEAIVSGFTSYNVGFPWMIVYIIAAIIVVGLIAYSLFKNGKRGWGWVCVGLLIVLVFILIKITLTIIMHLPESSSSSWSPGGFGGGFGGGSSGGGGATGSW